MQTSTEHVKKFTRTKKKDKFTEESKSVKDYLKKKPNKINPTSASGRTELQITKWWKEYLSRLFLYASPTVSIRQGHKHLWLLCS